MIPVPLFSWGSCEDLQVKMTPKSVLAKVKGQCCYSLTSTLSYFLRPSPLPAGSTYCVLGAGRGAEAGGLVTTQHKPESSQLPPDS